MQTLVTIGSTVSAYAEILVDIPEGASRADAMAIIKQAKNAAEAAGNVVYKPDWSTHEHFRVVAASDETIQELTLNTMLDHKSAGSAPSAECEDQGASVS